MGRQGCVWHRVLFRRALPRAAAEVLPEAVGAHPQFCVSATKERTGAFREGSRRGAVSLGMSQPCGRLSTVTPTRATTILTTALLCWSTRAQSKVPALEGVSSEQE